MKGTIQVLEKKRKIHFMLRYKKSETENDAYDHPQENETTTFSFHLSLHFSSSSLSFSESEFLSLSIKSFFLSETYLKISHSLFPFSNEYHST